MDGRGLFNASQKERAAGISAADDKKTLEMLKVSYEYGKEFSVKEVDLSLRPGEIVAIIGENGSGKTTLMKLAAGTLQPRSGDVVILGKSILKLIAYLRSHRAHRFFVSEPGLPDIPQPG